MKRRTLYAAVGIVLIAASCIWGWRAWRQRRLYEFLSRPSAQAIWPWPHVVPQRLRNGVTHWFLAAPDGTTLDLLRFDFRANPRLRLELCDEDSYDATPLDNKVLYWQRGLGAVTRDLNHRLATPNQAAPVIAIWNGSYFGLKNLKPRNRDWAFHNSPIVLHHRVLFNRENHRWTFGVRMENGRPHFEALHLPGRADLQKFEWACGGTQCLLHKGQLLQIRPYPWPGETPQKPPVPSTPQEAGHIPTLDHMKTSRLSLGWTPDSTRLYLLVVKEPDGETPSRAAVSRARPAYGGWMLQDVQRFWLAMQKAEGVQDAVALDGGDVAQLAFQNAGRYTLLPPRLALPSGPATQRLACGPDFANAPQGGSIMNFYLREATS